MKRLEACKSNVSLGHLNQNEAHDKYAQHARKFKASQALDPYDKEITQKQHRILNAKGHLYFNNAVASVEVNQKRARG